MLYFFIGNIYGFGLKTDCEVIYCLWIINKRQSFNNNFITYSIYDKIEKQHHLKNGYKIEF